MFKSYVISIISKKICYYIKYTSVNIFVDIVSEAKSAITTTEASDIDPSKSAETSIKSTNIEEDYETELDKGAPMQSGTVLNQKLREGPDDKEVDLEDNTLSVEEEYGTSKDIPSDIKLETEEITDDLPHEDVSETPTTVEDDDNNLDKESPTSSIEALNLLLGEGTNNTKVDTHKKKQPVDEDDIGLDKNITATPATSHKPSFIEVGATKKTKGNSDPTL